MTYEDETGSPRKRLDGLTQPSTLTRTKRQL
jgi:hypothetical protein